MDKEAFHLGLLPLEVDVLLLLLPNNTTTLFSHYTKRHEIFIKVFSITIYQ